MPKIGMEPVRRQALIDATISAIGERGALDVTMSDIAGRAGVSAALAHHYFGAKEELLHATMRHLLTLLGQDARSAMRAAADGHDRVRSIIAVNFSRQQFRTETIAAWLSFYVDAQKSTEMRRLLRVYARRLHSNLMSGLVQLMNRADAQTTAEGIAAMIDGLYIRRALKHGPPDAISAMALIEDYLDAKLRQCRSQ